MTQSPRFTRLHISLPRPFCDEEKTVILSRGAAKDLCVSSPSTHLINTDEYTHTFTLCAGNSKLNARPSFWDSPEINS